MSWFGNIFGGGDKQDTPEGEAFQEGAVPPARQGLNGEYDQSGLAKRVAKAFDEDPELSAVEGMWVAQTGATVVLKGKAPSQDILNKLVAVASQTHGALSVDTNQVTIG
jgi:hypothetical protein